MAHAALEVALCELRGVFDVAPASAKAKRGSVECGFTVSDNAATTDEDELLAPAPVALVCWHQHQVSYKVPDGRARAYTLPSGGAKR